MKRLLLCRDNFMKSATKANDFVRLLCSFSQRVACLIVDCCSLSAAALSVQLHELKIIESSVVNSVMRAKKRCP